MSILRRLFSDDPKDLWPEVPKDEPPDPSAERSLPDSVRTARRNLVAACGLCLAWSSAQFALANNQIDVAGTSVDLKDTSIPLLLGILLVYLTIRWGFEFAMMPRNLRRWPLAQLDFRMVLVIARIALVAVAAGALNRSLLTVVGALGILVLLAIVSFILTLLLTFIITPLRMWSRVRMRARASEKKFSAFWTVYESLILAGAFSVFLSIISITSFAIASYYFEDLQSVIWHVPPDPLALSIFVFFLIAVFLSHWLFKPIIAHLFAERPPYYTERAPDGRLLMHIIPKKKEPLL
jgi:hypothetical protein